MLNIRTCKKYILYLIKTLQNQKEMDYIRKAVLRYQNGLLLLQSSILYELGLEMISIIVRQHCRPRHEVA